MDWSNERYVRLYTRDTVNWRRLKWEGQTVLVLVLRKLDRSGVLDLGGCSPVDAVELITGLPTEVVEIGLERCIKTGTFTIDGDRLVMTQFLNAQESEIGTAERQRRWRSRIKRDSSSCNGGDGVKIPHSNATSTNVTNENATSTSVDATSTIVTKRNPYLAEPNQPNQPDQKILTAEGDTPVANQSGVCASPLQVPPEILRAQTELVRMREKSGRKPGRVALPPGPPTPQGDFLDSVLAKVEPKPLARPEVAQIRSQLPLQDSDVGLEPQKINGNLEAARRLRTLEAQNGKSESPRMRDVDVLANMIARTSIELRTVSLAPNFQLYKPEQKAFGVVQWSKSQAPNDWLSIAEKAYRAYLADEGYPKESGWSFDLFAKEPGRYLVSRKKKTKEDLDAEESAERLAKNRAALQKAGEI